MRIAYLTQSYPPMISGAAHVVAVLAGAMAKCGHPVLVVAASDTGHAYRMQEGDLTLLRLQSLHNPMRMDQRFLVYPRGPVLHALREFEPEVLHVHEPLQLGLLGTEYARKTNVPAILTVHQLPSIVASYLPGFLKGRTTTLLWIYARWFARKFMTILTPTQTISNLFTAMTGVQARTISSGIDLETFHPVSSHQEAISLRQKWNLPRDVPILLHVGRLDVEKRVDRVIRAAARTLNQTDAHLVIVGDGTQKPALLQLCNELNIAARVHFTGFVSAQEGLPEIYRGASLFITASEIETQGIVLLEAAASGLPVVAARATCIHEIVHEGINGYLTEPGDIAGMANTMAVLLKNPDQAKSFGIASRVLAEKHNVLYTLDAHERLYDDLVRREYVKYSSISAISSFKPDLMEQD
jgi:glycosyltransferase involved in cell wall biosynthesis